MNANREQSDGTASEQEAAFWELKSAYCDALAIGSPSANAFANLAWILSETPDLSLQVRAEAILRWLEGSELDQWRSPILASEAGKRTLTNYDYRKAAAEKLRAAAERFLRSFGIPPQTQKR